ncbi:MAG: DUF1403 family protein [Mesorhizobium sp.]|nr:MAG: DUF1403 family protein [Mesorhizobium sp.]
MIGRTEDEAALRDTWLLRQHGDEPGPAGNVLAAWRRLAGRSLPPHVEDLQTVAALLGAGWSDGFSELIDVLAHGLEACRADSCHPDPHAAAAFGLGRPARPTGQRCF